MISRTGTTTVLISGATGKLGQAVYAALADSPSYDVLPFTLGRDARIRSVSMNQSIEVVDWGGISLRIDEFMAKGDNNLIVIDCTPVELHQVAGLYAYALGLPTVVLGSNWTPGSIGDNIIQEHMRVARDSDSRFMILRVADACLPLVGLIRSLGDMIGPGLLEGFEASVEESRSQNAQGSKRSEVLGTTFQDAGAYLSEPRIVEDRATQRQIWGVPERYLDCHQITKLQTRGRGVTVKLELRAMGYESHAASVRDVILPEFIESILGNPWIGVHNY